MKKSHFELKNYVTATSVFVLAVVDWILIITVLLLKQMVLQQQEQM